MTFETAPAYEVKEGVRPHFLVGELKMDEKNYYDSGSLTISYGTQCRLKVETHGNASLKMGLPHTRRRMAMRLYNKPAHQTFCPDATPEDRAIFHERARNLMHPPEKFDPCRAVTLCRCRFKGEYFGVELELVREFSDMYNLTPIPCCPEHIVGNMNLRGNIVTIA